MCDPCHPGRPVPTFYPSDSDSPSPTADNRYNERLLAPCEHSPTGSVYHDARDTPFSQRYDMGDEITDAEFKAIEDELGAALGNLDMSDDEYGANMCAPDSNSPMRSSDGSTPPPSSMGMRRAGNVANLSTQFANSPYSSAGSTSSPSASPGMRRAATLTNLSTFLDWNPFDDPVSTAQTVPGNDATPPMLAAPPIVSSPEWENGEVRTNLKLPFCKIKTGQRGRSESFEQWHGNVQSAGQGDPQPPVAITPFVHNVEPDLEAAIEYEHEHTLPSPGDPDRCVRALEFMLRTTDEITGHLRWLSRCCDPNQQPLALKRSQHCIHLFQTIGRLYKDCIYEISPEVFTVSHTAANSLIVATRRVDRSVSSLAALACKLGYATRVLLRDIDLVRHKKTGQSSDLFRRLQSASQQPDTPTPPGCGKHRSQ